MKNLLKGVERILSLTLIIVLLVLVISNRVTLTSTERVYQVETVNSYDFDCSCKMVSFGGDSTVFIDSASGKLRGYFITK